jgi:Domain of unknown function (DUF4397)
VNRSLKLLLFGIGLLSLAVILLNVGCGSSGTKFRVMNAVIDESSVDVLLDGTKVATEAYGVAPTYISVSSGSRHLQIEPTGSSTPFIDQTLSLSSGNNYTVVAVNFSSSHQALVLSDQNSAPASGDIAIRVVNASPGLGAAADIYIVAPGTDLNTVTATISDLAFGGVSTYQTLAAGSYEVLFTTPANGGKFIEIDSGTLSLTAGQVRTVVGLNVQAGGFTDTILADLN